MNKGLMVTLLIGLMVATTVSAADFSQLRINLLNQDPDPAKQGEYLELRFKVEKLGNDKIEDVTFELDTEYPFSFDGTDQPIKKLGSWIGYSDNEEFYTLYYKIRLADDALEGTYDIPLHVSHKNLPEQTQEFAIRVDEKKESSFVVGNMQTSPRKLVADTDEAQLEIDIENIGDENAEHMQVTLNLPEGIEASYSYADRENLGTVEAGASKTATFYIDIPEDIEAGAYDASLTLKFKEADDDDNVYLTKVIPIQIPIKDRPKLELVSYEVQPQKLEPGQIGKIMLKLANVGGKEAESVSVKAFKDSTQPFDYEEKSDFVGNLDAGEEGEAVIVFEVEPEANAKEYQLDLEMRTVYENEVLIFKDDIIVQVVEAEKNDSVPQASIGIGIVVAIVVVGLIAFFTLKGSKKKKK
ncbi:hypothetical protein H6504_01230 [Candidatus Woesearchaeota archaeon]|nr:hypothetical protein [Candidatus Woesearchaeota archaeon]